MQEIRHIHHLAMTPVWSVAPHPQATADEAPGSFRRHDIAPFSGGMKPPPWPQVDADLATWVHDVVALGGELEGPARFVPLPALVDADVTLVALRQAAARGRLNAIRGTDGAWQSTRKAVDEYKESRQHAGRRGDAVVVKREE